ncbi:MAG: PQQ-binding-like beta-propeller repeat protein [Thermoanaerobaculia bacterium]
MRTLDAPMTLRRPRRALGALAALLLAGPASGAAPSADAVAVGKWWGKLPAPKETVDFGIEIRRDEKGDLRVAITQPIAGYFDMAYPGEVKVEGRSIAIDTLALTGTIDGDRLSAKFGSAKIPLELRRVEALPSPPPIPRFPAGPGPRWQTRLSGQIFASPAVADGIAYVGTTGGVFDAVKTSDGTILWTFEAGRPIFGAARLTADAVYFVADNGYLFKLARQGGKELWRYDLGDARESRVLPHPDGIGWDFHAPRPLVIDDTVYVGSGDGSFHAVDVATGARRWRFATGGKIRGGAAQAGDRVVFGSADHFVYSLDRATGEQAWKHDTKAEVENEPAVAGDRVVVGNRGVGLVALASASGEELWHTTFWGSWLESTPTVDRGVLYVGSSDMGRVSALDPGDGRVLWRADVFGWTFGTPLVVGERIYAGAAGGTPYFLPHAASLCVLDRSNGSVVERWPLPESADGHMWGFGGSLALAGDTIVATSIGGSVYGFPLRPPA